MKKVINTIEKVKTKKNLKKAIIRIKPLGRHWEVCAYYPQARGYPQALVNPYHVKKIRELEDNSQTKTGTRGSLLVARLVRGRRYFNLNLSCSIYAELQRLSRLRLKIEKVYVREKTKLRTLLDEYFPEYETIFYDILGGSSLHILKNYFLPKVLAKENILELACTLQEISRGKIKARYNKKLWI